MAAPSTKIGLGSNQSNPLPDKGPVRHPRLTSFPYKKLSLNPETFDTIDLDDRRSEGSVSSVESDNSSDLVDYTTSSTMTRSSQPSQLATLDRTSTKSGFEMMQADENDVRVEEIESGDGDHLINVLASDPGTEKAHALYDRSEDEESASTVSGHDQSDQLSNAETISIAGSDDDETPSFTDHALRIPTVAVEDATTKPWSNRLQNLAERLRSPSDGLTASVDDAMKESDITVTGPSLRSAMHSKETIRSSKRQPGYAPSSGMKVAIAALSMKTIVLALAVPVIFISLFLVPYADPSPLCRRLAVTGYSPAHCKKVALQDLMHQRAARHGQLIDALSARNINRAEGQLYWITDAMTTSVRPQKNNCTGEWEDHLRPDFIARVIAPTQLLVSLPPKAPGWQHFTNPTIQVRTLDETIALRSQEELIDGVTLATLDIDGVRDFYVVEAKYGGHSEAIVVPGVRVNAETMSNKSSPTGQTSRTNVFNHVHAPLEEAVAAIKKMVKGPASGFASLAATARIRVQSVNPLTEDAVCLARANLQAKLQLAQARGRAIQDVALSALSSAHDEALQELREMSIHASDLARSTTDRLDALVASGLKPALETTRLEIQQVLHRANRNGRGILERMSNAVSTFASYQAQQSKA